MDAKRTRLVMTTPVAEPQTTEAHGRACGCIDCALAGVWFAYMRSLVVHDGLCREEGCRGECVPERPSDE